VNIKQVQGEGGKALENALKTLQNKVCKVGWIENARYPSTKDDLNPPFIAEVVVSNEFGRPSSNVPARPFLRPTIARDQNLWEKIGFEGSKKVLKNQLKIEDVLDLIGSKSADGIRKSIRKVYSPALSQRTILKRIERSSKLSKIKGKISYEALGNVTKPLIDTGLMLATIAYKVENE
jgi:hypothetical protein